jgi:short-subunit dehydrogenase
MFTESLSIEVKGTGVRVQALCPGLTRTEFQSVAGETGTDGLPDVMWQTADEVVDASLAGLRRNRVLVVSGAPNKALIGVSSVMPHGLKRRVAAFVMEQRGR